MRAGRRSLVGAVGALTLTAGFLGAAPPAWAAGSVSLTALGAAYTQNFDSLASTGTSSTLPDGWYLAETGTAANTTYTTGTGSSTTGDTYSFGPTGSSERAFGTLLSGSVTPTIGAQLTNATGATITSLDLSYTGEMWRLGATGRSDSLTFEISTDATSLTSGSWTTVGSLDFSTPDTTAPTGLRDGNSAPNRTALSATVASLSIAPGASVWLRWRDVNPSGSDDGLAVDDFSLTPHGTTGPVDVAPSVVSTSPANDAVGVAHDANLTVTFSEPVTVGDGAFRLFCDDAAVPFTVSGGSDTYTVDPSADFGDGDSCSLTVEADAVTDNDGTPDHPDGDTRVFFYTGDVCAGSFTPAYEIQGAGQSAAVTGSTTTRGIVVGDYEAGGLDGFYLQDEQGDGNSATSDAVFVHSPGGDDVNVGDRVWVAGSAGDYQGQTEISRFSGADVTRCGTGTVAPTAVTLPFASPDSPERYEGMLVNMTQTLTVTEHFQLGRFGEVLMSSGGRLPQPTSIVAPGAPAQAQQEANNLNQILFDDASQAQNPDPILFGRGGQPLSASNTLRGGDTATNTVGVLTYTWGGASASPNAYRLRPVGALGGGVPDFQAANPRPTSAPDRAAGTDVRVAGMNLLNFFNTFTGCRNGADGAATDCRGAESQAEFDRQWPKTVAGIVGTGADVIGINEIENDGYGPTSAIQFLVDKLNAATAPGTYAFIDVDANTGQVNAAGTDAIKVGVLYKPAVVTPVGNTAALNSAAFVNGGDGSPRSRPSIAQAFEDTTTGARFVVDVNHLKSKGSACATPDAGDGSGNCDQVRTNAAIALAAWLDSDPTGTGDPDVLLVGDYNSYAMERPVKVLEDAGYTNLIRQRIGRDAYSYVFDGQWGYLDYAFGSSSVQRQLAGVYEWHINADEPSVLDYNTNFKTANLRSTLYAPDEFRISDHDPVLVDLDLVVPYQFTGFFAPAVNPPAINSVKAGATLPVKFRLGGDRGLDVFASGPTVTPIVCTTREAIGAPTPAEGELAYVNGTYVYTWKTAKRAAGTCQALSFTLNDATGRSRTLYAALR
jgi:predicted extracellular nuclease